MAEALPGPPVPLECDLRDFAFMPLDVQRLRDSDLASEQTPEENWAAVLLWAASWHQVPAASIPDSENWIAKAAGYMARGRVDPRWKDVKEGAMRGFTLCADGRWYHAVVAEKANDAWRGKLLQRWRTEIARIRKHNQRHDINLDCPEFEDWLSHGCLMGQALPVPEDKPSRPRDKGHLSHECPTENDSKGEGEGQGEGQGQGDLNSKALPGAGAPGPDSPADLLGDQHGDTVGVNGHRRRIPGCPQEAILALWREMVPNAIQPKHWDPSDREQLAHRWRATFERLPDLRTEADGMQWFRELFESVRDSDFLMGRTHGNGKKPFKLRLPWLMKRENFKKTVDGTYAND